MQPATFSKKIYHFYKVLMCLILSVIYWFSHPPLVVWPIVLRHAGAITLDGTWIFDCITAYPKSFCPQSFILPRQTSVQDLEWVFVVGFEVLATVVMKSTIFWLRHYAASQKVAGFIPDDAIGFFIWLDPSGHNVALGSTQSLTEMNTRNLPGGKVRLPVHKAGNLTAIYEPIVQKMWEPGHLTTLWASRACYRDSSTFFVTVFWNTTPDDGGSIFLQNIYWLSLDYTALYSRR
jgi:hypothetical protein